MSDAEREQHSTHTLAEILADRNLSAEERIQEAAKKAPFWIIAVSAHAIVFAVLLMFMTGEDKGSEEQSATVTRTERKVDDQKIEEQKPEEKELEVKAIPKVEATDIDVAEDTFSTVTDDTVNPNAQTNERFGMAEGTDDAPDNLLTMSSGGKGLAGAIGIGSGTGAGGGTRRGSPLGGSRFGRRTAQKAQLEQTEKVVMAGLDWLKRHQNPDGSWDAATFTQMCDGRLGPTCTGKGSSIHIAGVTGLALLTYLGAGYDSNRPSAFLETVKKGLKWLKQNQDAEGCFGPRTDGRFTYSHACATLAMCEAYASTKSVPWKKSAQEGLNFIHACQNTYKAWRYGVKPGDNDTSVTGWMLMALKSGKDSGLTVSDKAMQEGLAFVDSMTDESTGRTGYTKKGEPPVRPDGFQNKWPGSESEALTAVAMCSRIFCGAADGNPLMKAGADLLSKKLPVWDESGGKIDMYYWYYGTLAMFQIGGPSWDAWNRNLKLVVVDQQIKDGCSKGSWDTKDPWCDDGGRVYTTALMTLCLEVYYRYPKVFGTGTKK